MWRWIDEVLEGVRRVRTVTLCRPNSKVPIELNRVGLCYIQMKSYERFTMEK